MNGPDLFEQMYAEDKEGQKLNEMPGLEDQLHRYPFWHLSFKWKLNDEV